jgi:hypothetical protein
MPLARENERPSIGWTDGYDRGSVSRTLAFAVVVNGNVSVDVLRQQSLWMARVRDEERGEMDVDASHLPCPVTVPTHLDMQGTDESPMNRAMKLRKECSQRPCRALEDPSSKDALRVIRGSAVALNGVVGRAVQSKCQARVSFFLKQHRL